MFQYNNPFILLTFVCIFSDFPPRTNYTWTLQELLQEIIPPLLESQSKYWNDSAYTLAVHDHTGWTFTASSGNSQPDVKASANDLFLWGSTTKMVTAIGIMKQVEDGSLQLEDKLTNILDPWLEGQLNGTRLVDYFGDRIWNVTIRQLLSMRSGIPDYDTNDLREYQFSNPLYDINPFDILERAHEQEWACDPGSCGTYSSTNFVLLGLVLVAQSGAATWQEYDQFSVFPTEVYDELKDKMYFPVSGPCMQYEGQDGHKMAYGLEATGHTVYNTSCLQGWSCGNMVATAEAVALLNYYLWGTEMILSSDTKAQMKSYQLLTDYWWWYGLGTMLMGDATSGTDSFYGHGGATYGFYSNSGYDEEMMFSYTIATNFEPPWPGDNLGPTTNQTFLNIRRSFLNYRYDQPKWYPPELSINSTNSTAPVASCSSHSHLRVHIIIGCLLGINVLTCGALAFTCWRNKQTESLPNYANLQN